jgi:tRNA (guanine37-N1)-methyltransferase
MDETPRLKGAWCAKVLTLFPETFPGVLGASLTGKALQQGLWALETIDLGPSARESTGRWTTRPRAGARGW